MKNARRAVLWLVLILFIAAGVGCSMKDVKKVGSLKIGGFAQTVNVDKDELKGKIKTQWGKFSFKETEVKKILKLKNVSKIKNTSDVKKNTFTCKKKIGGKNIMIAVTYVGKGRYQLAMGGV